ncbi:MAG: hypothetical protein WBV67_01990 [Candidatus Cybelea sp.]
MCGAHAQGVRHAELFFDPQAHTQRGIAFSVVVEGIWRALADGRRDVGISSHLIMCFLRDLSAESAMATLESALPFQEGIVAVGLDSAERDNPPSKFRAVFDRARANGFLTVAHAGEEAGPATVCPLSNLRLRVVPTLAAHPLKRMIEAGLMVTCNSDDPAYFGGYAGDNFRESAAALALTGDELIAMARNSFEASFIDAATKREYLAQIESALVEHPAY